jgi:hypothetical protein
MTPLRRRLLALLIDSLEAATAWVLRDFACACCGLVTPRCDLQLVPDLGLYCHACLVGHLRGHWASLDHVAPPRAARGR